LTFVVLYEGIEMNFDLRDSYTVGDFRRQLELLTGINRADMTINQFQTDSDETTLSALNLPEQVHIELTSNLPEEEA